MNLVRTILVMLALATATAGAAAQQFLSSDAARVALVVGNSNYEAVDDLPNAGNDARLVADTLQAIGFDVSLIIDAGGGDFAGAVTSFAENVPEGAVVVVYYAGHGVQVEGQNYLLPVDVALKSMAEVQRVSVSATAILEGLAKSKPATTILILDACRDDPFPDNDLWKVQDGLAIVETNLSGSLVAFSTAPGKVAFDGKVNADGSGNSPYTLALVDSMRQPGLSIESVFKRARSRVIGDTGHAQVPWENSSLTRDIYLVPAARAAVGELTECDLLAGHPTDPDRVHAGVAYELLRPIPAIAACEQALAEDPGNPRLASQLARALEKNGDYEQAVALNEEAVAAGYIGAYHNLGNLYRKGAGVPQDLDRALELFLYAAERGHPEDAYNVGNIYLNGTPTMAPDLAEAKLWFERAAEQDYPSSFDRLGLIYLEGRGVDVDIARANAFFERGAALGDPSALVNYANAFRKGTGVEVDYARAFDLYMRAAQLRRRSAYVNLAEMYRKGQGVDVNLTEAAFWYGLAGRAGDDRSEEQFETILEDMASDEAEQIEARIEEWMNSNFG